MTQQGIGAIAVAAVGVVAALVAAVALAAQPVVVLGAVTAVVLAREARRRTWAAGTATPRWRDGHGGLRPRARSRGAASRS